MTSLANPEFPPGTIVRIASVYPRHYAPLADTVIPLGDNKQRTVGRVGRVVRGSVERVGFVKVTLEAPESTPSWRHFTTSFVYSIHSLEIISMPDPIPPFRMPGTPPPDRPPARDPHTVSDVAHRQIIEHALVNAGITGIFRSGADARKWVEDFLGLTVDPALPAAASTPSES